MTRERVLLRRIRILIALFTASLVLSGLTAFALETEVRWLARVLGAGDSGAPSDAGEFVRWITTVRDGLIEASERSPFLAYGTDWLAFGHLAIAVAFLGPIRDPVRNIWVITVGMIACVGVIPTALIAGAVREIPLYWRLMDCSFGVIGFIPLWFASRDTRELERLTTSS